MKYYFSRVCSGFGTFFSCRASARGSSRNRFSGCSGLLKILSNCIFLSYSTIHQKLISLAEYCRILQNLVESCRILQHLAESNRILQNIVKSSK